MSFIGSEAFQSVIPETNWMYPAVTPPSGLPKGFDTLLTPGIALLIPADEAAALRGPAVDEWKSALGR